ncbi:PAS domain S-box protein [Magnetococcales bacterium HHB-1]
MAKKIYSFMYVPFLRNVLLAFLTIAILIPIYERYRVFPQFRDFLTYAAEDQAIRVATHLSAYNFFKNSPLDRPESIPEAWIEEVSMVSRDLKLEKVKVFSRTGEVIFSTNAKDVGKINERDYFHNIVAKGQVFTKVVEKDGRSLEGRRVSKTVVETYVPVMRKHTFVGSFEVYFDIAAQRSAMNALLKRFNYDMIFMGMGLTLLALILVTRAAKEMHRREEAQAALSKSEKMFRGVSDSAKDAIVMVDCRGKIALWNFAATQMFGYEEKEVLGLDMHKVLVPERFRARAYAGFMVFAETGRGEKVLGQTIEMVSLHKDGSEFPVEVSTSALKMEGRWHAIGILRDITERKEAERKLKLGARVMEHAADGICVTDHQGIIKMVNPAFSEVTGYLLNEVVGKRPNILQSGRHDQAFYKAMWKSITEEGLWRGEIWNRRKDGDIYPQQLAISAISDINGQVSNYVAVFNDISQRKENEANLERLAFYDPLTGIPNRLLFRERLSQAVRENHRYKTASALMFIDLDRFKQVNDVHGHEIGDLLLQEVAKRLHSLVRAEDTVSRLGGDEFTVILRRAAKIQDAKRVANQIIESMSLPFVLNGITCHVGASVGIAFHPFHAKDMEQLIKYADLAMYDAKKGGRNRYHVYNSDTT